MAAVPAPIRAPAPASTRATRTAPARRCAPCSSRSKTGSRTGVAPPDSRVPRIADGSLVDADDVRMPAVPGFAGRRRPTASRRRSIGWTRRRVLDNFYGARVCAVDADGNEIAGIRLPPIAVPLGTYTGWNVYRAQPCELCDRDGSLIPFARTRSEREAAGDPRPSLEERYGSRDAYVAKVRAAAAALVAARLLLPSDAGAYLRAAESLRAFLTGRLPGWRAGGSRIRLPRLVRDPMPNL